MGQSVATLRRNSQTVATLNGLRNLQSLDVAGVAKLATSPNDSATLWVFTLPDR